jgi:hypothetical protein
MFKEKTGKPPNGNVRLRLVIFRRSGINFAYGYDGCDEQVMDISFKKFWDCFPSEPCR